MQKFFVLLALLFVTHSGDAQPDFAYRLTVEARQIPQMPALHSFVYAQHAHYWLFLGGRQDGIHARQPFNAFPASGINQHIWLVDRTNDSLYSLPISDLPDTLNYQLQCTNINFFQDGEYLFMAGGYGIWPPTNQYTTPALLSRIHLPGLINSILQQQANPAAFSVVRDSLFAITGGQMGKLNGEYLLIGGHYFQGRYNPMGPNNGPGFIQHYSNQIRKFSANADSLPLQFSAGQSITDAVHLHRRDYNLLPQIFPNGEPGYMISSGVFQQTADLPFLYPVDIGATAYRPRTDFHQLLSHYHGAKLVLYDSSTLTNHNLFFGGLAQYYLDTGGQMVQDNDVPFVNTISRVSRDQRDSLYEFKELAEMPVFVGAGSAFLPNPVLPKYAHGLINMNRFPNDTIELGHVIGGIVSPVRNAFTTNTTSLTAAGTTVYRVLLIPEPSSTGISMKQSIPPYDFVMGPNPTQGRFKLKFELFKVVDVHYLLTASDGSIIEKGRLGDLEVGNNLVSFDLRHRKQTEQLVVTLIFENKHFVSKKLLLRK
ncbi:MAG: hypothetical protein ACK417_10010 [Bacteroidia bacterium]